MGYDYYFINETKKHVVGPTKWLYLDFEDKDQLVAYLSMCKGDTIRIVGEESDLVNAVSHPNPAQRNYEYKYIELFRFSLGENRENEDEVERFVNEVRGQ